MLRALCHVGEAVREAEFYAEKHVVTHRKFGREGEGWRRRGRMFPSAARRSEADMMGGEDEARKGVCAGERCFKKGRGEAGR